MKDLKGVWTELSNICQDIDSLKEIPWSAIVPRKIRQSLEDILNRLKVRSTSIGRPSTYPHFPIGNAESYAPILSVRTYSKYGEGLSQGQHDCCRFEIGSFERSPLANSKKVGF